MANAYFVAAWAEDFAGEFRFNTEIEAIAFARGWSEGAGNYGAGKTTTYVLPRDQKELKADTRDHGEYVKYNKREAP